MAVVTQIHFRSGKSIYVDDQEFDLRNRINTAGVRLMLVGGYSINPDAIDCMHTVNLPDNTGKTSGTGPR